MISVVCPFYNEESIMEASVSLMLRNLEALPQDWELVLVNDGSKDASGAIAEQLTKRHPRLRVCGYVHNKGRGHALREGIAQARGEIVVTTEIDSSWGDDIVARIVAALEAHPEVDMVIASTHREGGGYKNVPWHRKFLSHYGNVLIRRGMDSSVTMYTGMTRGYRREAFLALPLDEDGKEMYLEVVMKALAFGYRILEIPAVIEWKAHKLAAPGTKRISSTKLTRHIQSHLLFSLGVAPFRYIFPVSFVLAVLSSVAFIVAIVRLFLPTPSIYWLLVSMILALFCFLFFGIGLVTIQNREMMADLWRLRSQMQSTPNREAKRVDNSPQKKVS